MSLTVECDIYVTVPEGVEPEEFAASIDGRTFTWEETHEFWIPPWDQTDKDAEDE